MYKGLQQQPTFVYTECSDATEVFVAQQAGNNTDANGCTSSELYQRTRFRFLTLSNQELVPEPLPLPNSPTSTIRRAPSPECRDSHYDLSITEESSRPRVQLSVISKKNSVSSTPAEVRDNEEALRNRLNTIPESLTASRKPRRKSTDIEFLKFAKEFARLFRQRPSESLLNPTQYDNYLQKVASRDRLHGNDHFYSNSHIQQLRTCVRSASVGNSTEDKLVEDGHVVGDLVSFAANTLRYFDNPDLSDVIIIVGENRFYCHKFALASQSDIFRDMLLASQRCTNSPDFQKELELDESSECERVFSGFLRFFYCGKISFTSETALPLLVLSAKYRVEALRSACDAFITGMIEDGDMKSSVKWLRYAARYQLHDLTGKCVDGAIADNIEELVDSADWLSLAAECVEAVLRSSSLLVPNEFYLFEALQRWFMAKRKSAPVEQVTDELRKTLQHIRFSQMRGTQLLAVEDSPIGLHYRSIIRTYLGDAYRYQILAKESPEFQEPQYLPRDYTDKEWCVQLLYHPTKNKRSAPSAFYGNGRWEIQPRRYYDTLNVVIILKKPLEMDMKVYISIIIYKRNGTIQMRLRRKACVLRALESPRPNSLCGATTSNSTSPNNTPRSLSETPRSGAIAGAKESGNSHAAHHSTNQHILNPHRAPHGPASKLHGPHNGQEYYAIDNIISDSDFQMSMSQSGPAGLKIGVIIRTWGVNVTP